MSDEEILDFTSNGTWCIGYLRLPKADRDAGLYATALNFFSTGEGLAKGWEQDFPKVVEVLRNGPAQANVTPFRPKVAVPEDATG